MANTYSQIYLQYVFAVQGRDMLITPSWRDELYKYMSGCINNHKCKVMCIGGVEDHVHILVSMHPAVSPSVLMADVKRSSSLWINERHFVRGRFAWQEGFGVFSYSKSMVSNVARYIENQEIHHKKQTFMDEYVETLKKFGVDYDERYVFHPVL